MVWRTTAKYGHGGLSHAKVRDKPSACRSTRASSTHRHGRCIKYSIPGAVALTPLLIRLSPRESSSKICKPPSLNQQKLLQSCATTTLLLLWSTMGPVCAKPASLGMMLPGLSSPPSSAVPGTRYVQFQCCDFFVFFNRECMARCYTVPIVLLQTMVNYVNGILLLQVVFPTVCVCVNDDEMLGS